MRRSLPPRLKNHIAARRKKVKLTQEGLAQALNTTQELISLYEHNHAYPDPEKMIAMCDTLKCRWGDLYEVLPP